MKVYQVDYHDGRGWQKITFDRIKKAIRQNCFDPASALKRLAAGENILVAFASYRLIVKKEKRK